MIDTRYRAFVSYSHLDREWGEWLHRKLEAYRVPQKLVGALTREGSVPRRLAPIFRDRDDLPTSGSLSASVEEALERSRFLIVICSPAAARSEWVDAEIRLFKKLHGENRILALVVDGTPFAAEDAAECFPPALRFKIDAAGALSAEPAEPLAADLRKEADGEKYALSKIVAGLIGVGLDDLIQREHHRRHVKMSVFAGAASVAALAMGGLAYVAIDARDDAQTQRDEAEGLVEFMLTDLREKLEPVGRLDALEVVGERALKYYADQQAKVLDADSLGRRSRALLLVGEIDNLRGDLDAALKAYMEAAATTEEQLRRDPDNAQRIFDHAQSVYWVGYIAWQRGDKRTAETQWREYLTLAENLVAIDAAKSDYQAELGYAFSNLGTLYYSQRRWDEALDFFEKSRELKQRRLAADPEDLNSNLTLAQAYSWSASVLDALGRFAEARQRVDQELSIYEKVLTRDPKNRTALWSQSVGWRVVSGLDLAAGDVESAKRYTQRARGQIEEMVAGNSDDTRWIEQASRVNAELADLEMLTGDSAAARDAATRAVEFAENLLARDRSVMEWRAFHVRAMIAAIETGAIQGTGAEIVAQLQPVLSDLAAAPTDESPDLTVFSTLVLARLKLGDLLLGAHDDAAARAVWAEGLAAFGEPYSDYGPGKQVLVASVLLRLGETQRAAKVAAELEAIGYRHPQFIRLKDEIARRSGRDILSKTQTKGGRP